MEEKSILITGGTGTFGKNFTKFLLENTSIAKIIIFSRDELKQLELKNFFKNNPRLRFFLGDVRDVDRLKIAFQNVDVVIHAAALKQVDSAEYNPFEYVKTNVLGGQNVIEAAIRCEVKKVIALSTDKASSPINLYGATKLTSDKLFQAANHYATLSETKFSVVRYGNVMGSRGSIIPVLKQRIKMKLPLQITDDRMTRFWISISEAVNFVYLCISNMKGGEIFVPKLPSFEVKDLIDIFSQNTLVERLGIRPGEKLHEEMISADDSRRTFDGPNFYLIAPTVSEWGYETPKLKKVQEGFIYNSLNNNFRLSKSDIINLLKNETNPI